ncbi:MAG: cache domain-containing protein [Desulfobulbaceae bacterium]|nr:cache domain-containing protein [Desulfobulbaceae bacterium]
MKKNLTYYFLSLLTLGVLLSVGLVGSVWLLDTLSGYRRDIKEMRTTYMQEQQQLLRNQVEQAREQIFYMQSKVKERTEDIVRERTDTGWMIADAISKGQKNKLSPQALEDLTRETLRKIRYPDLGYYFAINMDGTEELFADRPEMEGRNMLEVQDQEGRFVVRDMLQLAKADKTVLYQYRWTKPGRDDGSFAKIAAIRYLPGLDWVIGTGMYLDEMEEQIRAASLEWLEQVRWGKNKKNYIFAGRWDGLSLTGPSKGRNMFKITDPNGVHIMEELIRQARQGGGFVEYVMPRFKGSRPAPKLAYAAPVERWQWYIGTGRYVDEIESMIAIRRQQLKQHLFSHLRQTGFILLLLSAVCLIMVWIMARRLKKNITPFAGFFHKAATSLVQIDEQALDFEEFRFLAHDANLMIRERCRSQEILSSQENLLRYLTRAGHQLLSGSDLDLAVTETLAILGEGCGTERVYLFEVEQQDNQTNLLHLRFEWTDGSVGQRINDPRFQHMEATSFKAAWFLDLLAGTAVQGAPGDFSKQASSMLHEYEVQSLLLLPVIYRDSFWGILCFDACRAPIIWNDSSIRSLQNFASTLCTAIMQRRSEQEAVKIRDQWVGTFNSIEDAIFLLDDGGRILNANLAALQILCADDLDAIRGLHLSELLLGDGIRFKECLADLVLEQDTHLVGEVHSAPLDKVFHASAFPVYTGKGQVSGVIYIARDITREKAMERQLTQAQKMEAIGVLAGGIAHDFNNILAAIMGFSELAQIKLQQGKTEGLESDLEKIFHAGERAKELVAQLLAFSRSQESRKTPISVSPIINETIKMLQAFIPTTIKITAELGPETRKVLANGTALQQVFMNLGSNAAHAMQNQGGELHISLEETELSPKQRLGHSTTSEHYLHIAVKDQGKGIDPLIVDKIFDPFFTTKKVGEGTGMGLTAVHGIIKDHGGFTELDNRPGHGATFHIYLPQSTEESTVENEKTSDESASGVIDYKTILVVDDEEMLLTIYKEMFKILGCTTLAANNPVIAVKLLENNPDIDLLCTDLNMPEMDGLQLAERCHTIRPEIPIILCSGLSMDLDEEALQQTGIKKVLAKPITLQGLKQTLERLTTKTGISPPVHQDRRQSD